MRRAEQRLGGGGVSFDLVERLPHRLRVREDDGVGFERAQQRADPVTFLPHLRDVEHAFSVNEGYVTEDPCAE